MSSILLATSGMFVLVAVLIGWIAATYLARHSAGQQRLHALTSGSVGTVHFDQRPISDPIDPVLSTLRRLIPKSAADMSRLQRRLSRGGYVEPSAALVFTAVGFVLPLAAAAATLAVAGLSSWVYALPAAAAGYLAPHLWLDHRITRRQRAIRNGLPDALDLLMLCVEAGNSLDQAVARTGAELALVHPALALELRFVTTEIRAGKPRHDAFRNLATRTGVDEIRALVTMLAQTDRFGTSMGQALRTHAETQRRQRRQAAEERAAKVSVKLVFPLACCMFPALYVVCFAPVAVRIFRAL